MEEWKTIAISRIKEVIICIENGDDDEIENTSIETCPVCIYMGSEYGIVSVVDLKENSCYGGWMDDGLFRYCEAWDSCVEFVRIVSNYLMWWPKRIRHWSKIRNRCIKKLQVLISTLNE